MPSTKRMSRLDTRRRQLNGLIAQQLAGVNVPFSGRSALILGVDKQKTEFAVYAKIGRVERYIDALDLAQHVSAPV